MCAAAGSPTSAIRLLPVFADLLPADPAMDALIRTARAPHEAKLGEKLAVTAGLLYRRGNFNGTFDQLILDAMLEVKGAQIAFSPGFRWGGSVLPGETITMERRARPDGDYLPGVHADRPDR